MVVFFVFSWEVVLRFYGPFSADSTGFPEAALAEEIDMECPERGLVREKTRKESAFVCLNSHWVDW